jgi:predicted RNase H-like HicB family nuclease
MVTKPADERTAAYLAVLTYEPWTEQTYTWMARNPDLSGCMSDGETPEEALANLADARVLYIEALRKRGIPVPEPGSSAAAQAILQVLNKTGGSDPA